MKTCKINESRKKPYALDLCSAHYTRARRHGGDPLAGRTPTGEPMAWVDRHKEYRTAGCLIWPYAKCKGYGVIVMDGRNRAAASVMCEVINGPPPTASHDCAHSCGNGHLGCVAPLHLRWATRSENCMDKHLHGTILLGEKNPRAKLKECDVLRIRKSQGSVSAVSLSGEYSVCLAAIYNIWNRDAWAWLD